MALFSTLVGIGSVLGAGANLIAGNEAADAVSDAAAQNSRDTRYMFDQSVALQEPWRQSGIGALNQQNALLGLAPVFGGAGSQGGTQWDSYGAANPDIAQYWQQNMPALMRQGFESPGDYYQWHFDNYGRAEGRQLPGAGGSSSGVYTDPSRDLTGIPGADPNRSPGDAAYGSFLDSGFGRSMLETTENDFNQYMGAFGAAGTSMSGSTLGALNDRNRRNSNAAFGQYYNALSGMSGTGANISGQQGQQGLQVAGMTSANNNAAAGAMGSSYMNAAGAFNNALQGGLDAYAYSRGGDPGSNGNAPSPASGGGFGGGFFGNRYR